MPADLAPTAKEFVPGGGGGAASNGESGAPATPPAPPALASAANAAPFVPGGGGGGAGGMSLSAAPFVPRGASDAPRGTPLPAPAPSSFPASATPGGVPLPDGDELLGMTAHTPGLGGGTGTPGAPGVGPGAPPLTPGGAYGAGGGGYAPRTAPAGAAGGGGGWAGGGGGGGVYAPPPPPPRPMAGRPAFGGGGGGPPPPRPSTTATAPPAPGGGLPSALARARSHATSTASALRGELAGHAHLALAQAADIDGGLGMPPAVGAFHSLYPLEAGAAGGEPPGRPSAALGLCTAVLKGLAASDGAAVALRRLDPARAPPTPDLVAAARSALAAWAPLAGHPNLAVPTGAFVSGDWAGPGGGPGPGPPALWFVHELFPGAAPLAAAHLHPIATPSGALVRRAATTDQLWSYLVQLACALRAAHSAGRAVRAASLHPSKVLLVPPGRLRLGSLGLADALAPLAPAPGAAVTIAGAPPPPPSPDALAAAQRADLAAVGRLVLELAASAAGAPASLDPRTLARLPPDLASLLSALCAADAPPPPPGTPAPPRVTSWHQLAASLGGRLLAELDAGCLLSDALSAQLALEAGHGRLLRVLSRLSAVTERPEGADVDASWAEAGDAYVLKLFRDFVFHQPPALGASADPLAGLGGGPAALDWGHVAECLAKLDAGTPERILLLSRDGATMLAVSYADVKRCVEGAWRDLEARAGAARRRARGEMG